MVQDISDRKRADAAVRRSAVLEERTRLAREIHDGLAQSLTGVVLQLENAAGVLPPDGESVRRHVDRAAELARSGLADLAAPAEPGLQ